MSVRAGLLVGLVVAGSAACGGSAPSEAPPAPPPRAIAQYSVADFYKNSEYFGASFSADGTKILVSSNRSGVWNAYAVPAAGGEPQPLTSSTTNAIFAASYFPNDGRLLYTSDEGGNELSHVYVRGEDGTSKDLTPGKKLNASFAGWADDDKSFFVASNERDQRYFDVYEYAADGYARTLFYRNTDGFDLGPISRDKRYLAARQVPDHQRLGHLAHRPAEGHEDQHHGAQGRRLQRALRFFRRRHHAALHLGRRPRVQVAAQPRSGHRRAEGAARAELGCLGRRRLEERQVPHRLDQRRCRGHLAPLRCRHAAGSPPVWPARWRRARPAALARRREGGVLRQRRLGPRRPVLGPRGRPPDAPHQRAQPRDHARGPGRADARPLQVLRRRRDPRPALHAAPGHLRRQSTRAGHGPRRPWRAGAVRLLRPDPGAGQPRLRRVRHQQPRQQRLRQDLLRDGRPQARRSRPGRRRRQQADAGRHRLRRSGPHRDHRRQLRRLHGAGRADAAARRVQGRRRPVRHLELDSDHREHAPLVGGVQARRCSRRSATPRRMPSACAASRRSSTPRRSRRR